MIAKRRARGRIIELLHAKWMTQPYYEGDAEKIRSKLLVATDRELLLWATICYGNIWRLMPKRRTMMATPAP